MIRKIIAYLKSFMDFFPFFRNLNLKRIEKSKIKIGNLI